MQYHKFVKIWFSKVREFIADRCTNNVSRRASVKSSGVLTSIFELPHPIKNDSKSWRPGRLHLPSQLHGKPVISPSDSLTCAFNSAESMSNLSSSGTTAF